MRSTIFVNGEAFIVGLAGSAAFFLEIAANLVILAGIFRLCDHGNRFTRARNYAIVAIIIEVIMALILLFVNEGDWQQWTMGEAEMSAPLLAVSLILLLTAGIAYLVCIYNLIYGCRDIANHQEDAVLAEKCKKAWLTYLCGLLFSSLLEEISDTLSFVFLPSLTFLIASIAVDLVVSIWVLLVFNRTYKLFHGQKIKELEDENKRLPEDTRGPEQHRG